MDRVDKDPEYKQKLCENFLKRGKAGNFNNSIDKLLFECIVKEVK
jgi:hypothetical protein